MKSIDLSILKELPCLNTKVLLKIQPLAPLSMVADLPGSYYKSFKIPNKKMVCGLIENLLGWHLNTADRNQIFKELRELRIKQRKDQKKGIKQPDLFEDKNSVTITVPEFSDYCKGSTYVPLLLDYFSISNVSPEIEHFATYDDIWKKAYRRDDAVVHPKGTPNLSLELIPQKRNLERDSKKPKLVDSKALEVFFKSNIGGFPQYYSTVAKREFIDIRGEYVFDLWLDNKLEIAMRNAIAQNNLCYLGTTEGWVNLNISKL